MDVQLHVLIVGWGGVQKSTGTKGHRKHHGEARFACVSFKKKLLLYISIILCNTIHCSLARRRENHSCCLNSIVYAPVLRNNFANNCGIKQ